MIDHISRSPKPKTPIQLDSQLSLVQYSSLLKKWKCPEVPLSEKDENITRINTWVIYLHQLRENFLPSPVLQKEQNDFFFS